MAVVVLGHQVEVMAMKGISSVDDALNIVDSESVEVFVMWAVVNDMLGPLEQYTY